MNGQDGANKQSHGDEIKEKFAIAQKHRCPHGDQQVTSGKNGQMPQWWRFLFTNDLGRIHHFLMISERTGQANSFCAADFEKNMAYALIFVIFQRLPVSMQE